MSAYASAHAVIGLTPAAAVTHRPRQATLDQPAKAALNAFDTSSARPASNPKKIELPP
jgi:hypothetical protein